MDYRTYHFLTSLVECSEEIVVSIVVLGRALGLLTVSGIARYGISRSYPISGDLQRDAVVVGNGMPATTHKMQFTRVCV